MVLPAIPTWATNANYASPGDPWDTDPTKVVPSPAKRAEGWEPTETLPAEYLNDWMYRVGQWLQAISDARFSTVAPAVLDWTGIAGTDPNNIIGFALGFDSASRSRWVAAFNSGDTTVKIITAANPRSTWTIQTHASVGANQPGEIRPVAWDALGDAVGGPRFVVPISGQQTLWSNSGSGGWNLASGTGPAVPMSVVGLFNSLFVVVGDIAAGHSVWTSTNGVTWAGRGNPTTAGMIDVAIGEDGASNPRIVAVGDAGGIAYSDNATIWTDAGPSGASNFHQVLWNAVTSKWFAFAIDGGVYTSANGITWAAATAMVFAATMDHVRATADGSGNVFVHAVADFVPEAYRSDDDGATWDQIPANVGHIIGGGSVQWIPDYGFVSCSGAGGGVAKIWHGINYAEFAAGIT